MTTHQFPVRIYYEDTDHGGVVYHANYLKFMERGRSEYLRSHGVQQKQLQQEYGILFAVTHMDIRFITPAHLDDALSVESTITHIKGARITFSQRIMRQDVCISEAEVHLACIHERGKACRIPQYMLERLGE